MSGRRFARWGPPGTRWGPAWRDPDEWWGPPHRRGPGVRIPVLVGLVQIIGSRIAAGDQPLARPLDVWAYLLLLAGPVALVFRHPYGPVVVAPIVAMTGALRAGYRAPVWSLAGAGYVVLVGLGRVPGLPVRTLGLGESLSMLVGVLVVLLLGEAARVQSRYLAELARTRAEQARVRAEQHRRQASEERLRIARELHDVLGP